MDKQQRETQSTERLSSSTLSTACKSVQVNGAAIVSDLIIHFFLMIQFAFNRVFIATQCCLIMWAQHPRICLAALNLLVWLHDYLRDRIMQLAVQKRSPYLNLCLGSIFEVEVLKHLLILKPKYSLCFSWFRVWRGSILPCASTSFFWHAVLHFTFSSALSMQFL